ncbi:MAG: hypothetical protein HWN67_22385 [Candidatus Helarchaeota archaeon]|nr:hypothetical protein [Candidatus Helarchaeota archaeon]
MNKKTRLNYEKRWFVLNKINPFDYKNSKEFNELNKHYITKSTFAAYKRIWRALRLKSARKIEPKKIKAKKVKPEKIKPVKIKKVKRKEKKIKIKPITKPVVVPKPEIEPNFYILNKVSIKAKKKKKPVMDIVKIVEPIIDRNEKIVSFYLKFYEHVSELFVKETIPKNLKIIKKMPKSIQKTSEIKDKKTYQIWKIIPELAKDTFNFGYICSGEINKEDFPLEINIPGMKVSSVTEKISEPQKSDIFLPELHKLIQTQKNI